jgi:hypothetical protein
MTRELALKTDSREISKRVDELSRLLDMNVDWDKNYDEYCILNNILDERYREENIEAFEKFFFKHIYAKEWNEIDPDILQSYSDWHKDMFGYRPRSTDKDW